MTFRQCKRGMCVLTLSFVLLCAGSLQAADTQPVTTPQSPKTQPVTTTQPPKAQPATKNKATKAQPQKQTTKTPAPKSGQAPVRKTPASPQSKTQSKEPMEAVQVKLDAFAKTHVQRANQTLRPNRQVVEIRQEGSEYAAWFSEVDTASVRTELYPSDTPGCQYVGHVIYVEKVYASLGKTKIEASKGEYKQVRQRRVRELTRYDKGQWRY